MSILEYSVAKKIYNNLTGISPAPDEVQIISKKVDIEYTDLSGTNYIIDLGPIPEGCVLLHSQLDLTVPFTDGSGYAVLNSGLGTQEESELEYPVDKDYRRLIFNNLVLDSTAVIVAQGEIINDDLTLNNFVNSLVLRFNMPGVWSAGGNLNTARYTLAGCGTQTDGLSFGGYTPYLATTEEYNGSSWSAGGNLATARRHLAGCGTQTAGLSFGGWTGSLSAVTEEYNGTSWSGSGALNTARYNLAGCGSQSAGLSFGGYTTEISGITEEYNGTSWSSGGSLNIQRYNLAGCGTQNSGLSFGGYTTTDVAFTEEYDGTNWVISNNLNTITSNFAGCGSQTAGLRFGGLSAPTEEYDGTNWSIGRNLNTERKQTSGCGTQTSGLCFGGVTAALIITSSTEEYDQTSLSNLTQGSLTFYVTYTHV